MGLRQTLTEKPFSLIVSLPSNDLNLARAAVEGGADIIKVHMNVEHRASGNSFGTLSDNEDFLSRLVELADGRLTGIVSGDTIHKVTEADIDRLHDIGIDFVSLYAHHTPSWLLQKSVGKLIAISSKDSVDYARSYERLGIDALEASIIPGEEYGDPLTLRDIFLYERLVQSCACPVVVPSQRKIEPKEVRSLIDAGVKALMIGAIVTGTQAESVYEATQAFRLKINYILGDRYA